MRFLLVSLSLLLLLLADTHFTARLDGPGQATVVWRQEARGCLYRNSTLISCYERAGDYVITFGHQGPLDAAYRPSVGDVYRLDIGGTSYYAPLIGRPQYLAAIRR